jgi:spermidine synthase
MSLPYQELDYRETPMGALILRRRTLPAGGGDVFEVKLGDDFLMSSQHTAGEIALATLGLNACEHDLPDVVVGGLGLGYTAIAALDHVPRIRSLRVIETFPEVIDWHRRHLVPLGASLTADSRCRLVQADFFALLSAARPCFDTDDPDRKFHAVLLDIDHSPRGVLDPTHAAFYTAEGLSRLSAQLHDGGIFALWSNEPPEPDFLRVMASVFHTAVAHIVEFPNLSKDRVATNTIYVAHAQP